jgi:homoserine O-acetyltransferase
MPSLDAYDATGIEYFSIRSFTFVSGVEKPIKVAYRSFNPASRKTVLIPTCYGGRINDTLNWNTGALKDYHVIVVAMLGNGESSAPVSIIEFLKFNVPNFLRHFPILSCTANTS